jgi:hypothetical protein
MQRSQIINVLGISAQIFLGKSITTPIVYLFICGYVQTEGQTFCFLAEISDLIY